MKTYRKTVITELAEAISSYDISEVSNLLSESGQFAIQNENKEIILSSKNKFIDWLSFCYRESFTTVKTRRRLNFTIIQCLHCVTGNPIIIFENGNFPLFSGIQGEEEKSGLVIKAEDHIVTGIELCFLALKTENPFIYEKRCIRSGL